MRSRIGDRLVLIVTLVALLFVLSQFTMAGSIIMIEPQTPGENIAGLQEWKKVHQTADDDQFRQIQDLNLRLTSEVVKTTAELSALKVQSVNMDNEIRSISNRVWAMLVAILAQLLNVVWGLVVGGLKKTTSVLVKE